LQNFIWHARIAKWSYGLDNTEKAWSDRRGYDGAVIGGSIPVTGFMVNDKGWNDQNDVRTRPQNLPLEIFNIRKGSLIHTITYLTTILGETIRLRLVNGGISQALMISIENHQFTIAASDGIALQPLTLGQKV
jgi:hypothetical protein